MKNTTKRTSQSAAFPRLAHAAVLTLFVVSLASTGCKTMEFGGPNWINQKERPRLRMELPFNKKKQDEEVFASPQKMAVIWKETELRTPGQPPVRGFGGRIYFYDDENQPAKVDGELVVYGFDNSSKSSVADQKFVFKKDKLQSHYGETELGHSYSFWVPWDKLGGDRKSITLIPAFKSADGKLVKGGQTVNVLPGPEPKDERTKTGTFTGKDIQLTSGNLTGEVIQAGHAAEPRQGGIRETTIRLPRHLANRVGSFPGNLGKINSVSTQRNAVEVLDESGKLRSEVLRQQIERRSTDSGEAVSAEKRERKPFGMPSPFVN